MTCNTPLLDDFFDNALGIFDMDLRSELLWSE